MFNRIATHYDFWSNLISAEGIRAWHHFALDAMRIEPGNAVLDVGCGTGTNTLAMAERAGSQGRVVGLDPSAAMIDAGRARIVGDHAAPISWVIGQGEHLPFSDGQFDAVSAQFSMRNMEDWSLALQEMVRVLKPNGRLLVLDVVQPLTTLGALAWNGLKMVTSRLTSPGLSPYQWLGISIDHAPTTEELRVAFQQQGLGNIQFHHWLGDLVVAMVGHKPVRNLERGPAEAKTPTLLWAVDGSITARAASEWINLFLQRQSDVEIVTVMPPTGASQGVAAADAHIWRGHAMDAATRLTPDQFRVRLHVVSGQPGPTIIRVARTVHATLIVVGEKGGSERRNQWVGSVARHVLQNAPCPVLIVPTTALGDGVGQFPAQLSDVP
nr:class I SAM-dependent methyltransferase [Sulfobacillus harzensis]